MALDCGAYPHLLDMVIWHADQPGLLAMRASSRLLCDRIDAILFRHLFVRSAILMWPQTLSVSSRRLPRHAKCGSLSLYDECLWLQRKLRHTGVLDVYSGAVALSFEPLVMALARVPIHRRIEASDAMPVAHTVVDIAHLNAYNGGWAAPSVYIGDVSSSTVRLVINVWYDPRHPLLAETAVHFDCLERVDVVWIFSEHPEDDPSWPAPVPPPYTPRPPKTIMSSFLKGFIWDVASRSHRSYAFVGVTEMDRRLIGLPEAASDAEVKDAIMRQVQAEIAVDDCVVEDAPPKSPYASDWLAILTHDEYRSLIGDDEFARLTGAEPYPFHFSPSP